VRLDQVLAIRSAANHVEFVLADESNDLVLHGQR
jgi:hypothetical protein